MEQELLTAQEAAELLKVKKATVYEMVKRGEIPAVKIGKQVRIDRNDLKKVLQPAAVKEKQAATLGIVLCGQDSGVNMKAN